MCRSLRCIYTFLSLFILLACNSTQAEFVVASGAGFTGGPRVSGNAVSNLAVIFNQFAFETDFRGGANLAFGDVNADGVDDLIVGAGPSGGPRVTVFDGKYLLYNQAVPLANFFALDSNDRSGISVASADVNADGYADVIVSSLNGAYRGYVAIFYGNYLAIGQVVKMAEWNSFPEAAIGVEVAAGDVNADGSADVVVGAGAGGGPVVKVFSGGSLRQNRPDRIGSDFLAYDASLRTGIHVGVGDVNHDGYADIVTGTGAGGAPHVKVFDGGSVVRGGPAEFFSQCVVDCNLRGGVYVAARDTNGDGFADLFIGMGTGTTGSVYYLNGAHAAGNASNFLWGFTPFGSGFIGGTWVAAGNLTAQCSNRRDDDNDGAIDLADFGCQGNPNDNNESDPKAQCQDGADNDGDGAVDLSDFSCQGNPQRNDEANPKAQCQDGLDNDGDGAVDLNDLSCQGNPQKNDEQYPKAQCDDGADNDGDGARDWPSDFSCSSKQDNDETNPKAQCQDGVDNDGDNLVDLSDPGCSSRQDNNEADGTSQCQNGFDDDNDGATDFPNDFSCASPADNDETNPRAQCQDGSDNDGDGLIDLADPGCSNRQDNNEADGTTQCQNGSDDDGDGAIDFPTDFSCASRQDNDEMNPKAQCQDGLDNDADGAIDFPADFSCASRQDNDEGDPKAQCQDGIDNDADGATDFPADFSCSSRQDNNETDPKAQCQDGLDNDSDGLIDRADPGCVNLQDNNEQDGTSQCQDGVDNDNDGARDFPADFSCSSPSDNDEANPLAQCQDGRDNDNDALIDLQDPGCATAQDNNESDGTTRCQNGIDDDGDNLIDAADPGCSSPTDNDESNGVAQCRDGLDNDGDGATDFPADFSCLSPEDNDEFNPKSQCQDGIDNDSDGKVDAQDPGCGGNQDNNENDIGEACIDVVNVSTQGQLDAVALQLSTLSKQASLELLKVVQSRTGLHSALASAQNDVKRSSAKADKRLAEARALTLKIPKVSRLCPNLPPVCREIDNISVIQALQYNYFTAANQVARTLNRTGFRDSRNTRKFTNLIRTARKILADGYVALNKVPRFAADCG